jgi:hypothetical protein
LLTTGRAFSDVLTIVFITPLREFLRDFAIIK